MSWIIFVVRFLSGNTDPSNLCSYLTDLRQISCKIQNGSPVRCELHATIGKAKNAPTMQVGKTNISTFPAILRLNDGIVWLVEQVTRRYQGCFYAIAGHSKTDTAFQSLLIHLQLISSQLITFQPVHKPLNSCNFVIQRTEEKIHSTYDYDVYPGL